MNKAIKDQLEKVKVANIGYYDNDTTEIIIPRFEQVRYEIGSYYLVKLDGALTSPTGNELLISNWNKGTYPRCEFLKIDVTKVLGKMIYVNALGYDNEKQEDLNYCWTGWLPIQQLELVTKLS